MAGTPHLRGFFCGLPCAPMTVAAAFDRSLRAEGGCPVCRDEVAASSRAPHLPQRGGREIPLDEAFATAVSWLRAARSPFVLGLTRSSNRTARLAATLAGRLGAALDLEDAETASVNLAALQAYGLPSATFGEIRNRADLILLWRCDPRSTHAAIFGSRQGTPLEAGGDRTVIVVPAEHGSRGPPADLVLPVPPDGDLAALLALRALLAGRAPAAASESDLPRGALEECLARIRRARYVAILWDAAAIQGPLGIAIASALTLLTRDLNRTGRAVARPLAPGNLAGAMAALAGAAGAPHALGFRPQGPARFGPAEFGAARFLGDARCDLSLLIGARRVPRSVRGRARPGGRSKTIVVGPRLPDGVEEVDLLIPTALPGLSAPGLGRRADGVPIVLSAPVPSPRPTEERVLEEIGAGLSAGTEA